MKDAVTTALEELELYAKTADSNAAMVAEVRKVCEMHKAHLSAWAEAEIARLGAREERRLAESAVATICQMFKIKPGELVP